MQLSLKVLNIFSHVRQDHDSDDVQLQRDTLLLALDWAAVSAGFYGNLKESK